MTDNQNYDIAIIGGGLAGLTLSILLGNQGWRVACIDREQPETQAKGDTRTTAISWGSRNVLTHAGIWQALADKAACISDILILDEDSPIDLQFHREDIGAEGFGWIVDNRDLRLALTDAVSQNKNITHVTGAAVTEFNHQGDHVSVTCADSRIVKAKLIVGADGRTSITREAMGIKTWTRDYNQSGIVCLITHDKPHDGWALEHFRAQGPFAVLPFTDDAAGNHRSAVVWTVATEDVPQWLECSENVFNAALQERCGDRYGTVTVQGSRAAWPLTLVKAKSYIADRMVLVAEAAHGMHPIAGQGLNMSLRDLAALTEVLEGASDPGDQTLLKRYQRMRRADNTAMVVATDRLNDLFGYNFFGLRAARRFGLHMVSRLPFARKFFMKQAMGAQGYLPAMVKDAA